VKQALVLRHHEEDDAGLIGEAFAAQGFSVTTIMIDDHHPAPSTATADALVVLGSNSSVYDDEVRERWFKGELELMRAVADAGTPILGICFGAQALCELLGGHVEPMGRVELGWAMIDVEDDVALSRGTWFEYHGDHCVLPDDVTVLARNDFAVQAFRYDDHVGVQFHPEVDGDQLRRWFATLGDVPRAQAASHEAFINEADAHRDALAERAQEVVDLFLTNAGFLEGR
jgi:GMP synthase-like glutamine amidotransferase